VGEEVTMRHPATLRPSIWLEHRAFQAAAHIVAWSEWAARSVVDDHGIDSRKVTVVPPGVRMWMLDPIEVVPRSQPRVLFIGNDFVRKGGRDLLDVFSEYFSERTELHLVTNDPLHIDAPNVHVHRGISAYSHEWQQLLASADIFVLPSYGEAFGLVLQEAATFGAAIIGSRAGGIPQTVVEGENGFLIDPGDKIALHDRLERLIADDALRLRMRQNSRARALEGYNAETNAHHLAEVFRSVARHPTLSS
jgi:starch synthase